MTSSEDRLPWYLDFTKLFIGAGVIGMALLWWLAAGQPGTAPNDGDYSCVNGSSFENHQRAEEQGLPYIFDPREDQFAVTFKNGRITEARVYPAGTSIDGQVHTTSEFAFNAKESSTSFTAMIDGVKVGCWQS